MKYGLSILLEQSLVAIIATCSSVIYEKEVTEPSAKL